MNLRNTSFFVLYLFLLVCIVFFLAIAVYEPQPVKKAPSFAEPALVERK